MKRISIRELHAKTGRYVRMAAETGEVYITDRGKTVAKIVPETEPREVPYFARRKLNPAFKAIMGKLKGGTDSTIIISEDRDRPVE